LGGGGGGRVLIRRVAGHRSNLLLRDILISSAKQHIDEMRKNLHKKTKKV